MTVTYLLNLELQIKKQVITTDATLEAFLDKYPVLKESASTHVNMKIIPCLKQNN